MKSLGIQKKDFEEWLEYNKIVILNEVIKNYTYDEVLQQEAA